MGVDYITDSSGHVVTDSSGNPIWSSYSTSIKVPDLTGMTVAQATTTLASYGLMLGSIGTSSVYVSPSVSVGEIQGQFPIPGFQVEAGSSVDVTVTELVAQFDINETVIARYSNNVAMAALIEDLAEYFDPTINLQQFYAIVWDMFTGSGFGLDIWGRILGVTRYLTLPAGGAYFGFSNDGANDFTGFGQAPFYSGVVDTETYRLGDSDFLVLLIAKAFANVCRTVIPVLNQLLMLLFGSSGVVYVQDNLNMSMTVVFHFTPTAVQTAIVTQSGVFPHPTGVSVATSIV